MPSTKGKDPITRFLDYWISRCNQAWETCLMILILIQRNTPTVLLTHWGRLTHICVSKTTIIGSDNGLLPGRCQAIIWTNVGILLIGTLGTNFSEILSECHSFSFKKMHMKMSGKWWPSCLGLNVLTHLGREQMSDMLQTFSNVVFVWKLLPVAYITEIYFWGFS